jgi:hypothetical protein
MYVADGSTRIANPPADSCAVSAKVRWTLAPVPKCCRRSFTGTLPPGWLDVAREVYDLFEEVCPTVFGVTLADTDRASDLVCGGIRSSARDGVHAAVMLNKDVAWIATFDSGFDDIPGIRRMKLS